MFGLGRAHSDTQYGVIIDIGSGSVGVGILVSDPHKDAPHLIFTHRVYTLASKNATAASDHVRQLRETLFSAILILSKDGIVALKDHNKRARINKILVSCAAPWATTISRNVCYEEEDEIKITESIVDDLIKSAEHEIETPENCEFKSLEVVERTTVDIRINEYSVANPIGLRGKKVELTHITGLVPTEILEAIYEVQEKLFSEAIVQTHTFMLVIYCVLRDIFPDTNSLSIINITGEATEFGIVEHGTFTETTAAPYGFNTLLREIAEKTNKAPVEIISLLNGFVARELNARTHDEVSLYLEPYRAKIRETIAEIRVKHAIPTTLVITTQTGYEELFRALILEVVQEQSTIGYTVLTIPKEILETIATSTKAADTFLCITGRFFHKLHGCGEIETH